MIKVSNVNAVDCDGALLNIIEATYQIDDGAFSGPGGTYYGEGLPGIHFKGEIFNHPIVVVIGKPDIFKFDGSSE